jgi:hypothetical protein
MLDVQMSGNHSSKHELPFSQAAAHRVMQMKIGCELKMHYELSPDLPRDIRALSLELDGPEKDDG